MAPQVSFQSWFSWGRQAWPDRETRRQAGKPELICSTNSVTHGWGWWAMWFRATLSSHLSPVRGLANAYSINMFRVLNILPVKYSNSSGCTVSRAEINDCNFAWQYWGQKRCVCLPAISGKITPAFCPVVSAIPPNAFLRPEILDIILGICLSQSSKPGPVPRTTTGSRGGFSLGAVNLSTYGLEHWIKVQLEQKRERMKPGIL